MYEWRIFKKLQIANIFEYNDYVAKWKKNNKYPIEKRSDLYFILPPLFSELNRVLGVKLRGVKVKISPMAIKVKGKKIEIKEQVRSNETKYELWQKSIQKRLHKKFKIPLYSLTLIRKLEANGKSLMEDIMKNSAPKKQQTMNPQKQSQGKQSLLQKQKSEKSNSLYTSDLYESEDHIYTTDPNLLISSLQEIYDFLVHKISKHEIKSPRIKEYMSLLPKCIADNQIQLILVDKVRASGNDCEETLIRVKKITPDPEIIKHDDHHQFWVTCAFEQSSQFLNLDDQTMQVWKQKYNLPAEGLTQNDFLSSDFYVGGYPEFLATNMK